MILSNLTSSLYMAQTKTHAKPITLPSGDLEGGFYGFHGRAAFENTTRECIAFTTPILRALISPQYTDNQLLCEADSHL